MKKVLILFAVFIFAAENFGQAKYQIYSNARFGYSIAYPSNLLTPQKLKDVSSSGEIFLSKGRSAELRVYGEYDALETGLKGRYYDDLKNYGDNVSYKLLAKDAFTISGAKNDRVFYQKTLRRHVKDVDVFYTFIIEYSKSESKKYNEIVERIAKSFKFDPNANV